MTGKAEHAERDEDVVEGHAIGMGYWPHWRGNTKRAGKLLETPRWWGKKNLHNHRGRIEIADGGKMSGTRTGRSACSEYVVRISNAEIMWFVLRCVPREAIIFRQ
jgi:hypothetical protein